MRTHTPYLNTLCRRLALALVTGACLSLLIFASTNAYTAPKSKWDSRVSQEAIDQYKQGNKLYNQKEYLQAIRAYHKVLQQYPTLMPKAYLNCARAYNLNEQYELSLQFYEYYFELVPKPANARKIRAEMRRVKSRAGDSSDLNNSSQLKARDQLEEALSTNRNALVGTDDGIYAYYLVLLRTGYVNPNLLQIQKKLSRRIEKELVAMLTPSKDNVLPNLDRQGWDEVKNHVTILDKFPETVYDQNLTRAAYLCADAWQAYYRDDATRAASLFAESHQTYPLDAASWGTVIAAFKTQPASELIGIINQCEAHYKEKSTSYQPRYFATLRAKAYLNMGDDASALAELKRINQQQP